MWWAIAASVLGAALTNSATNKAGRKAIETGTANAEDLRRISALNAAEIKRNAGLNADSVLTTADLNSKSITAVAEANSMAQLDATSMNIGLAETENLELLRRHQIREVSHLSSMRAAYGASGVQVGQGSPIEVMDDALATSYGERQYMGNFAQKRLMMMGKQGIAAAKITMLDAGSRSKLLLGTAALQASMIQENAASRATTMLNDAEANALSLERGGGLIASTQRAQGTASLMSGIMGGINTYMKYNLQPATGGGTTAALPFTTRVT
jgi:hypothetical protein